MVSINEIYKLMQSYDHYPRVALIKYVGLKIEDVVHIDGASHIAHSPYDGIMRDDPQYHTQFC